MSCLACYDVLFSGNVTGGWAVSTLLSLFGRVWLFEAVPADDVLSHKGPAYDRSQIMRSERIRGRRFRKDTKLIHTDFNSLVFLFV